MAWKSSQPRRSAALKSDRLSFRTTVRVGSPNACGSGLAAFSKYWVAMATPPSLVVARAKCGKPGSTNLPDGTCCDRCSKYSAIEVAFAKGEWFVALRHHWRHQCSLPHILIY